MDNHILSALKAIDVSTLSRADWIAVGMALKEEGYPCSIWDDWSRNDSRYHPGECERKWNSFHGSGTPVKGGTIVQMAKDRGWTPFGGEDGCMNWDDAIEYDGEDGFNGFAPPDAWSPAADLITYLELLFDADDRVGYVTNDVWQDAEGKWLPSKGVYDRTAGELIASLKKYPDDLGATVGDWKPEVGAWIRFNPLDGDGVKNENITKFRFALVESDTLPVAEQDIVFRKLELPIAALVHSGGKSLHAIVRVDAENYDEYRKRVEFLYDFLEKNGVSIDKQNRNPSRLADIWYTSHGASYGRSHHYNDSRYHMLNLHATFTKGTVEFRLFQFDEPTAERRGGIHAGQLKSYIQLCLALSQMAKDVRTASPKPQQNENPKYAMRTWLLRLGFIGEEFATARDFLTRNLTGDTAFRHGRAAA